MRNWGNSGFARGAVLAATLAGTLLCASGLPGVASGWLDEAQDKGGEAREKAQDNEQPKANLGRIQPPRAAPKGKRAAGDPLANQAGAAGKAAPGAALPRAPVWPFHYTLRFAGGDGQPLAASYYPAKTTFRAPVAMLLHETGRGRSGSDFEEPIEELKGRSFARFLQDEGYAVLVLDLRGHGQNARKDLNAGDWRLMLGDLQSAYTFLIDRHNRGELNLARLGIVAVGDSANLALGWAASPGGGVSSEGRLSDIGALVLVSPSSEAPGLSMTRILPGIAARFPMLVLCGDRDAASVEAVRANQRVIERHRLSRVAYQDTSLHGNKLLCFFPKITTQIAQFLDDPVKSRVIDWEPRYLLNPVEYGNVTLVADSGFVGEAGAQAPGAAAAKAKAAPQPDAKDAAKNR